MPVILEYDKSEESAEVGITPNESGYCRVLAKGLDIHKTIEVLVADRICRDLGVTLTRCPAPAHNHSGGPCTFVARGQVETIEDLRRLAQLVREAKKRFEERLPIALKNLDQLLGFEEEAP